MKMRLTEDIWKEGNMYVSYCPELDIVSCGEDGMNWNAVFFDFDGVIPDSVYVKTKPFAKIFRHYGPEVEQAVVDHHLANGGVSRFEKFEYYYTHIL